MVAKFQGCSSIVLGYLVQVIIPFHIFYCFFQFVAGMEIHVAFIPVVCTYRGVYQQVYAGSALVVQLNGGRLPVGHYPAAGKHTAAVGLPVPEGKRSAHGNRIEWFCKTITLNIRLLYNNTVRFNSPGSVCTGL